MSRTVVLVDGIDGSGKSTFAEALAGACAAEGSPAVVLHVDDFRRPVDWSGGARGAEAASPPQPIAGGAEPRDTSQRSCDAGRSHQQPFEGSAQIDEAGPYYERYYDLATLDECVRAFLDGVERRRVPRFDPAREALDGEQELRFAGALVLVVEGVFVLRAPSAAVAPLVWLEVSEGEARRRILERDVARGRAPEVVEHRIARRYQPAQARYRAAYDPAARATVVVDNQSWAGPRMLRCEIARLPEVVARALRRVVPS